MASRVLLVGKETNFGPQLRERLRGMGLDFVIAQDAEKALVWMREAGQVDLILTELELPDTNGLSLLARLQNNGKPQKAVLITPKNDLSVIRMAMNLGAYDLLLHPLDLDDTEQTIRKALLEIDALKSERLQQARLEGIQRELKVAKEVQRSILSTSFHRFAPETGFELYAETIPAKEVGGDFYDFFQVDEQRWGFVIADVSGKGMPAALFMAISRTMLRAMALKGQTAGKCLTQVNQLLSQDNPMVMFVTLFYGILNVENGLLEYCNAGHNPPYIRRADGRVLAIEGVSNPALGIQEDLNYHAGMVRISRGDHLLLYTDGITEARNAMEFFFTEERLKSYLQKADAELSSEALLQGLIHEVNQFAAGLPQSDDITALVLRYVR